MTTMATAAVSPVSRRVRAYFAPVDRAAGAPTIFDAAQQGAFPLDSPPAPWLDLGWCKGFARKSGTKVGTLLTGAPATVQAQVRTEVEATVSVEFEAWGKLQLALASGSQQMNLLQTAPGAAANGSGGTAAAAVPLVLDGSTSATQLNVGAAAASFPVREVPEPHETRERGTLLIWAPPVPGRAYLFAVDTAGGGPDGDYSVVQVVDLETGMQCAELQRRLRPAALAEAVVKLAGEYRGATIVVERNNHGGTVLAHLEREAAPGSLYVHEDGELGWLTTSASKPRAIVELGLLLIKRPEMFYSRRLLAECRTYVAQPQGGTGAAAGSYDDCVMAMAIAQAVRAARLGAGKRGR